MAPAAGLELDTLRIAARIYTNVSPPRALVAEELDLRLRAARPATQSGPYALLTVVAAAGPLTLTALAGHLSLRRASAERGVRRLAVSGLIAPLAGDRWQLTEHGRALLAQVPGPHEDGRFAHALETLTLDGEAALGDDLEALLNALQPGARTPAPGPGARLALWLACVRVWRIARDEQTRFLAERTAGALDAASYQALYRTYETPCTVADVAAFLHVDEPAAARFVERLEAAALVDRGADPQAPIVPTAGGAELIETVPPFDPLGRFPRAVCGLPEGGRRLDDALERLVYGLGATPAIDLAGFDALLERIGTQDVPRRAAGVGRDAFRSTMAQFPTGVAVVTIRGDREPRGITVNSLTSVSLDPPTLLVCFDRRSAALEHLTGRRVFAANVLTADQQPLAARFGRRETAENPHALDEGMSVDVDGVPILVGALASIVCDVVDTFDSGSHTIVLASPRRIVPHPAPADVHALGFWRSRYFPVRGADSDHDIKEAGR